MTVKPYRFFVVLALTLFMAGGCVTPGGPVSEDAVELNVGFSWKGTKPCSHRSPEIRVANLPDGTVDLKIRLKDLDVPNWNHGGGTVAHDGTGTIPAGALKAGYNGPCPPSGRHRYEFSVKALDADGSLIGFGKAMQLFPPK